MESTELAQLFDEQTQNVSHDVEEVRKQIHEHAHRVSKHVLTGSRLACGVDFLKSSQINLDQKLDQLSKKLEKIKSHLASYRA